MLSGALFDLSKNLGISEDTVPFRSFTSNRMRLCAKLLAWGFGATPQIGDGGEPEGWLAAFRPKGRNRPKTPREPLGAQPHFAGNEAPESDRIFRFSIS